jgi:predicted DCC family thiol-disulfide oxidoreductase YuxK
MTVYRGEAFKHIRQRLPPQLIVFDGQCNLQIARVAQILERNFTFLLKGESQLRSNQLFVTTWTTPLGKRVKAEFKSDLGSVDSVALIRKVPSAKSRGIAACRTAALESIGLGQTTAGKDKTKTLGLEHADLEVLVKSKAVFCIMSNFDRFLLRYIGLIGYYGVPACVGDPLHDAYMRRREIWGRREEDIALFPTDMDGLPDRLWKGK